MSIFEEYGAFNRKFQQIHFTSYLVNRLKNAGWMVNSAPKVQFDLCVLWMYSADLFV